VREVPIYTETISLGAFLKWAGIVRTGGEAKHRIQAGEVRVNGEVERRRGRLLRPGDVVEADGMRWVVGRG
jgi:ribosome-associated protein